MSVVIMMIWSVDIKAAEEFKFVSLAAINMVQTFQVGNQEHIG